ncbi:MAG: CHAT domain-containing protein, partial [Bacteroidota bacterium]
DLKNSSWRFRLNSFCPYSVTFKLKLDVSFFNGLYNEETQKATGRDSLKVTEYGQKLFNLNRQLEFLRSDIQKNYAQYYDFRYGNQVVKIPELQSTLEVNEAIIDYMITDSTVFAFLITQSDFKVFQIDKAHELVEQVKSLRSLMDVNSVKVHDEKTQQVYASTAYAIYRDYLKEVLDQIENNGIDHLICVTDAELGYLPFDILLTEEVEKGALDYRRFPYLGLDYTIRYSYSANLLVNKFNIVSGTGEVDFISFAPIYTNQSFSQISDAGIGRFRDAIVPLEWNSQEANTISQYLEGQVYLGQSATERTFKLNANRSKILHMAMHALVDDDQPMNSKLVFAQDNDSIEDGYLHTFELYNMELNAELAVLSACETGYGKMVKGEGIMSLAQAFSYSGVPSVVMSHWKVDDKATSEIMDLFYKNLSQGQSKSKALRNAKITFLENADPATSNPFYWGSFVLIGDDNPIVENDVSLTLMVIIAALILTLVIFMLLRRRRLHKRSV